MGRVLETQKKLDADEEEASEALLDLHSQMAKLQSDLAAAASRLARIRKIRKKVEERGSVLFARGMDELDREDGVPSSEVLPALSSHEQWVVRDLNAIGVSGEVDWSSFGIGPEFSDLGPVTDSGEIAS